MPTKFYRVIVIALLSLLVLVALSACGGGDDDEGPAPTPTATSRPPTATATSAPTGDGSATPSAPIPTPLPFSSTSDAPAPQPFVGGDEISATLLNVEMLPMGAAGLSGSATLIQIARLTKVTVSLEGAGSDILTAVMRRGRCPTEGEEPQGKEDYGLFDMENGESISMVNTPTQFFQFSKVYILVSSGTENVSCGNVF
ncbi:MAG: hypothetical protein IH860_05610 [Chloroflexi bacterium]|nr:hypothetical protein [Chloroflexota bacterium]